MRVPLTLSVRYFESLFAISLYMERSLILTCVLSLYHGTAIHLLSPKNVISYPVYRFIILAGQSLIYL